MLEPHDQLVALEAAGNGYAKMGLLEALHTMPFGAVWEAYCDKFDAPSDLSIIDEVATYEHQVLQERNS